MSGHRLLLHVPLFGRAGVGDGATLFLRRRKHPKSLPLRLRGASARGGVDDERTTQEENGAGRPWWRVTQMSDEVLEVLES